MLRSSLRTCLVLVFLLGTWKLGADAHAQFRSKAPSARPDTLHSLAPPPLDERQSLKSYVRDPDDSASRLRSGAPSRYDPVLSRGQKLLWGSVGLLVQSLCDTDGAEPVTAHPDFALEPQERACIHCDRMEARSWDAVLEGVFSSSP